MRNAPPVVYPVGRFAWGHGVTGALAALACLAWLGVFWSSGASALQLSWQMGLCVLVGGLGIGLWPRECLQHGELAWDGETWHAQGAEHPDGPVRLELTFDAGHFMLVHLRPVGQSAWAGLPRHACLREADMPSRWHGFRCAVYSRRMGQGR